jgi:DNA-binding MarR family transcriptional regulator
VKWLTAVELDSWLSVVRLMIWLPWSIDQQLQRDSNLRMVEYQVLAMLSETPERTMRMSSLAELTNASLSRLSHLVKRLERRGFVRREPDPDGRQIHQRHPDRGGLRDARRSSA